MVTALPRQPSAPLVPEWLTRWARATPHRVALIAGSDRYTFGELDRLVSRTARRLAGVGVTEGSRVALLLPNGALFAVLVYALARLGAISVPLNARLAVHELAWQLRESRAAVLIFDASLAAAAARAAEGVSGLLPIDPHHLAALPEADTPLRDDVEFSAVQAIIYTSATSGSPKGAQLTYGNHWWNAIGSALNLGVHRSDAWLALLPFYHVGGLAILWRSVIYGVPVIIHESFDPEAANHEVDRGEVTTLSAVSPMLARMLDARRGRPYPPSLRCILLGGGPIPRPLLETCVRHAVPVAPTYGLTEAASQVATLPPEDLPQKMGSSGHALFPVQLRIEAEGRPAAAGEVGEILVRGPTVMCGYADRPEETARVLRDGWLHTGDLGYLDEEGYLYVVDRRHDLIVSGGENVYPAEVEAVLLEHPAIADAAVVGIPDAVWGQTVTAAVKLRPSARLIEDKVRAFCAARIAGFKVPRRIRVVDAIPRSAAGKVQRHLIRDQVSRFPGAPGMTASTQGRSPGSASRSPPDEQSGSVLASPPAARRQWVRGAFHAIAGRYDLLNTLLSGGLHLLWKRAAVRAAGVRPGGVALDVCCGTADMLLHLMRAAGPRGRAIGVDFAPGMLAVAARRLASVPDRGRVTLLCADAEMLPLGGGFVDGATMAFGLRNLSRPARALAELQRVLRPGGRLAILEFGQPRTPLIRALYDAYSRAVIPRLGGWLSGRPDAYQYLHDSIRQWPDPDRLAELLRDSGFTQVRYRVLAGGIAVLHVGVKPA